MLGRHAVAPLEVVAEAIGDRLQEGEGLDIGLILTRIDNLRAEGHPKWKSVDLTDIPPAEIPTLPNTPSPPPMPNIPITDIPGANSGGSNNGQ